MKKWLFRLCEKYDPSCGLVLYFWEMFTSAGNLVCRSTRGFMTEEEANRHKDEFHPPDHF